MKGPPLAPPRHTTVNETLAAAAETESGVTFVDLHEQETALPYREIHLRARRTGAALQRLGIAPGDRVALVFPTGPGFLDAFFGVLFAGAVPVPLYPPVRLGRLAEYRAATTRMLRAVGARLVLADARVRSLLGEVIAAARPALGFETLDGIAAGLDEVAETVSPSSLGLIQFSSGSTTDPKPVALSHARLMAQLSALRQLLPAGGETPQKGVSWLPLYHDMGLIGCLLQAVYYPGPLVLMGPEVFLARPALWLRTIARHRATISVAPLFGFEVAARRAKDADLSGLDLSTWRVALCGAEPISYAALGRFARRFERFGFDRRALRPVYGLAEASLAVTFTPADREVGALRVDPVHLARTGEAVDGTRAIVSVGTPVPGAEVEVRGPDGRPAAERAAGRIFVRGPSVMDGYFAAAEASAAVLAGDWLDTGDVGFVAGGELYVSGRDKDVVVIRGANHAPQEFEECLAGVSGLRTGCAVALGLPPDGEEGERLLILAERAKGTPPEADAATADLACGVVLEQTGVKPHAVHLLEPGTLPRTSSGKLRRAEALRRFLAGELEPPRAVDPLRLVPDLVRSSIAFLRVRLGGGTKV